MSYRELRNFTEMMRALGYSRPISMENFRTPNFELVADVLFWLSKKYDPFLSISEEIDTEEDRIEFLTSIASGLLSKARIKLNTKKLYAGDGHAVKELLKVTKVLYAAAQCRDDEPETTDNDDEEDTSQPLRVLHTTLKDTKITRTLSTDITDKGAKLYDLLESELEMKAARDGAIRFLDTVSTNLETTSEHRYLEKSVRELVAGVRDTIEVVEKQVQELAQDELALSGKMEKKKIDLERSEKRLRNLNTVRPAFMDEYERLEKELEFQYTIYCERFRNLDYLEHELDLYNTKEQEKVKENDRSMQRMQKRLRDEELRILRGEQQDLDASLDNINPSSSKTRNNQKHTKARRRQQQQNSSGSEEDSESGGDSASGSTAGEDDDPTSSSDDNEEDGSVSSSADSNVLIDREDHTAAADSDSDDLLEGSSSSDDDSSVPESGSDDASDHDF